MGKGSAPKAPDPVKTAQAQAEANKEAILESAKVNQINQVTPYGTVNYTGTIGGPDRTQTTSLAPAQQQQLDNQNRLASILGGAAINQSQYLPTDRFSMDGISKVPGKDDFAGLAGEARDAAFAQAKSLLDPQFKQQGQQQEDALLNRGLLPGQEQYDRERGNLQTQQNKAYTDAALGAVGVGNSTENQYYNQGMQSHQQQANDLLTTRNQPFNELAAFLQGSPALNQPTANPTAQYNQQPVDIAGLTNNAYNQQLNAYNQRQQQIGGTIGSVAGLAGNALAFFSSEDWKDKKGDVDTGDVLDKVKKLPLKLWSYNDTSPDPSRDPHMGPMAEQFQKSFGVGDGKTIHVADSNGVILSALQELAKRIDKSEKAEARS